MIWGKANKLYNTLLKSKKANNLNISSSYYIGGKNSVVNLRTKSINQPSPKKKAWVSPKVEFLADYPETVMLWSDLLGDFFWYSIDKDTAIRLRMAGLPVYDNGSIETMMLISNGGHDIDNVRRVHQGFKKMALEHKNKFNTK
jgi:hypothetical protein